MSREVRRVPVDWQHPTRYNPHWVFQSQPFMGRPHVPSRLHDKTERFIGLRGDYPAALAEWEQGGRDLAARTGWDWKWHLNYNITGYQGHGDTKPTVHPFWTYAADGETEISIDVCDEDHLAELLTAKHASEKPDPDDYMPVFDAPADELGWCLYETVSEGTPVTPVFATADELIDHLATVGQDWDQVPMRRTSAEAIVRSGSSLGSFVVSGGVLYDSTNDADVLSGTEATS